MWKEQELALGTDLRKASGVCKSSFTDLFSASFKNIAVNGAHLPESVRCVLSWNCCMSFLSVIVCVRYPKIVWGNLSVEECSLLMILQTELS